MTQRASRLGSKARTALALIFCLGASAGGAQAAGKPEKAYLESKLHVLWPGLRTSELSRFDANQVHLEHARDVRMLPGILRYTQSVPLPIYDLRSTWDVITEFNFEDFANAKTAFAAEGDRSGKNPWMARFAGGAAVGAKAWRPAGGGGLIVRDHVMVDGYEQGYKWFGFMRRKEGVSKEQADAYMRDVYAPAVAKLPGVRRYVLGLSYTPKDADGYWGRPPEWDAVDMIWFDSLEDMKRFLGSMDYQENAVRPAEATVIDQSKTISFAADYVERVPFPPRYEGPKWEEIDPTKTRN